MPDRIELVCGKAAWLHHLQTAIAFVAAALILAAPSSLDWRLAAFALLAVVFTVDRRWSARNEEPGALLIRLDGTVIHRSGFGETIGILDDKAWVSRWVCVVCWTTLETAKRRHSLVCASLNSADDYRRLRVWLRLGSAPAHEARSW
jgi:hypothetical protein